MRFGARCKKFSVITAAAIIIATLAAARPARCTDLTRPSILVATRELQDPLFVHSVILMVPSTEPPLLAGLIINVPAKQRVGDVFPGARQLKEVDQRVYAGGPVEPDAASVIFRAPSAIGSSSLVLDDTYVATGHDTIAAVLKNAQIADVRVILGRAQWLRDQLYSEVMAGAWYVIPAKSDLVFGDPKDLWSTLVKGGDLEEAGAGQGCAPSAAGEYERVSQRWPLYCEPDLAPLNLPYWRLDGTNWQRRILPN